MLNTLEMRTVFTNAIEQAMRDNDKIVMLDADLAKASGTFKLRKEFPDRALDVGIAEQNMASIAAGLASYGFIPFIHSFAAFASRRIVDQIAISIAYAKLNVKIVGTDPGIAAENNGGTHMPFEDIGVLRSIPNLIIYEPTDNIELAQAIPQIIAVDAPVYIRLFRKVPVAIHSDDYKFDLNRADVIREGKDVTLCASGLMVATALEAADILAEKGVFAEVIVVHTVKPIDAETIIKSARKTKRIVTCENHNIIGGLYSAVAETMANNYPVSVKAVGVKDRFGEVGKMDYLRKVLNLTAQDIVNKVMD